MIYEQGNYRLTIEQDEYPECPRDREDPSFGHFYTWHRNYAIGDKHNYDDIYECLDEYNVGDIIFRVVYAYEHGGITIRTSAYKDYWDSGVLGIIFMTKDEIRKEWNVKRISPQLKQKILDTLDLVVEEYDDYLTGNVWWFKLEELNDAAEFEEVDSCGNIVGDIKNWLGEFLPKEVYELFKDEV